MTGNAERLRQLRQRRVVLFLVAEEMTLQLDVRRCAAEQADEAIEQAADAVLPRVEERGARPARRVRR